jgi:myo-inositol-1(or 4)-monophosphatase
MCNVACGRFDLFYHGSLKPWDVAAAMLIIQEAGGIVTDDKNQPATYKSPGIVAANPTIHRLFFEELNEYQASLIKS